MAALIPLVAGLGACGSSTALLDNMGIAGSPSATGAVSTSGVTTLPSTSLASTGQRSWRMVAFEQLHGAPDSVRAQVMEQVTRDAVRHGMVLRADPGANVDLKLRGYLLVESDKKSGGAGTAKIVYVWDVLDARGARVGRVAGEEVVAAVPAGGDKWAAVPSAVLAMIAEKAVACLGSVAAPAQIGGSAVGLGTNALGATPVPPG